MALTQSPNVLLMGPVGSGKTHALSTLAKAGLECFVIITEPTGLETLLDVWQEKKLPLEKLHYKLVAPARIGFTGLLSVAKKVSALDFEGLAKLKPSGDRAHAQWLTMLEEMCDFTCDRTGEKYGPIDKLTGDKCVVLDSLSGVNLMAMDMVIGDKANAHQGEWGVAMSLIDKLLLNLTSSLSVPFVLTAHMEREANELTGATQVMASTLGKKLAPRIPRFFSEVVMAKRTDAGYYWSTAEHNTDLKHRSLPLSDKLAPDFAPIIAAWRKRIEFAKGAAA